MKKLVIALTIVSAMVLTTVAEDAKKEHKKPELTADQKALVEKYDTNKDGKLDKDERAKMTAEDKAKMPQHKKADKRADKRADKK